MNKKEAINILTTHIKEIDNIESINNGIDIFYDNSYSGNYYTEFKLENGNYLIFDGDITINWNEDEITDVFIENFTIFEYFDGESLETIKDFTL